MYSVKVYGAGSIGNHLSHACRNKEWEVSVYDNDTDALRRMKNKIYPERYGKWDKKISLLEVNDISEYYDIVVIGTPPESHVPIALEELRSNNPPRLILIEKPLTTPDMTGCQELYELAIAKKVIVLCGYNHTLTQHTQKVNKIIELENISKCKSIHVQWLEHWGGIFKAHPWLAGPSDSYLGFNERGGGATYEHSHGINIWQHFANTLGMGRISCVTSMMKVNSENGVNYDEITQLIVTSEKGLHGTIIQDVITKPTVKKVNIQCENDSIVWEANKQSNVDSLIYNQEEYSFVKSRPDDFVGEINHISDILEGNITQQESPISLEKGLTTMLVAAAASLSAKSGKEVHIKYDEGYSLKSLKI